MVHELTLSYTEIEEGQLDELYMRPSGILQWFDFGNMESYLFNTSGDVVAVKDKFAKDFK